MPESPYTRNVRTVIRAIPRGRVATYAQVAALAGNHRAVRGVVWILHSSSEASGLPWHRVISSRGTISLPRGRGFEEQRKRLIAEGVAVSPAGRVDLARFLWEPKRTRSANFARAAARFLEELKHGDRPGPVPKMRVCYIMSPMTMKDIKNQQQLQAALQADERVCALFYASWCPFSRRFLPDFDDAARANKKHFSSVKIDDHDGLCEEYGIDVFPTVIFFEKGKVLDRVDARLGAGIDVGRFFEASEKCIARKGGK